MTTTTLWTTQILLALVFCSAGSFKAFGYERARASLPWVDSVPRSLVRFIGVAELLGGLGLLLPWATGMATFLVPIAAGGLASAMLLAIGFHVRRHELRVVPLNLTLLGMATLIVTQTLH